MEGKFARERPIWTPDRWDDGYVNTKRFRVYRPDFPRCYADGYALRAHVVWWLERGEPHGTDTALHHINGDKLDDRIENLAVVEHGKHTRLHHIELHWFRCEHCGERFSKTGREVGRRRSEGKVPRFCSTACYHAHPRSDESRARQSEAHKRAWAEGRR